jgi:fructokinase
MFDVVSLGELLIDFTEYGLSENGMKLFEQNPGGAVANVACAVTRLGGTAAHIGKVGNDMHGSFLRDTLHENGVDVSAMVMSDQFFTTLAFVSLNSCGERAFSFARKPGADTQLMASEIDVSILQNTRVLHIGSLSMTDEPSRSATLFAIKEAKNIGAMISYDPNYRPSLWQKEEDAILQMRSLIPYVDIMKLSDEETKLLTGHKDPVMAAQKLLHEGVSIVAVTLGKEGTLICMKAQHQIVKGFNVKVVDTTGAGDAFWGGFIYCMTDAKKTHSSVTFDEACRYALFGNATAAKCISKRGAIPAMPKKRDVQELLNMS